MNDDQRPERTEPADHCEHRRTFLRRAGQATALLVLGTGCGHTSTTKAATGGGHGAGGMGSSSTAGQGGAGGAGSSGAVTGGSGPEGSGGMGGGAPLSCAPTAPNIEGPYYKPGAPPKADLRPPAAKGTTLRIRGVVRSPACEPIAGAILDVWQADPLGGYDNAGFAYRGVLATAQDGSYEIVTFVPGHYLNGKSYRPAHVHVKVAAENFAPLTTQLYFEGDPYNDTDPFIDSSLIMKLEDVAPNEKRAQFDFTVRRAI